MELKTAIEILEYHQQWRLDNREEMIHEPKKLTQAIDVVLSEVKKVDVPDFANNCDEIFNEAARIHAENEKLCGCGRLLDDMDLAVGICYECGEMAPEN